MKLIALRVLKAAPPVGYFRSYKAGRDFVTMFAVKKYVLYEGDAADRVVAQALSLLCQRGHVSFWKLLEPGFSGEVFKPSPTVRQIRTALKGTIKILGSRF